MFVKLFSDEVKMKTFAQCTLFLSLSCNDNIKTETINADFYTPAPIVEALQLSRSTSWSTLPDLPTDGTHCSIVESSSSNILMLSDSNIEVDASVKMESAVLSASSIEDEQLLSSMFQWIEDESSGAYAIASSMHRNFALDIDVSSGALLFRDVRSGEKDPSTAAYLLFTIVSSTPLRLQATGRMLYNSSTDGFDADGEWSTQEVLFSDETVSLTEDLGTEIMLYKAALDVEIPFDFNPSEVERVSNPEVTPEVKGSDSLANISSDVVEAYSAQVLSAGVNSETNAAAETALSNIESSLIDEGSQLRYPAAFYLALRDGLLSRELMFSDSTDGELGQSTVPYVFFTNESDESGVHHPFMVLASYGLPDSLSLLWGVSRPPGDGVGDGYDNQSVTRSHHRESFLMKIPLRDYGLVESLTENVMVNDLASDVNETELDHHNYASVSATGVAIDGVLIYPTYNNALQVSQSAAELSAHGMHSGRGLGVHYHADAHSAAGAGLNLYNESDYAGHTHPPIVSIGFDGVAGYGVYQSGDSTSDGAELALDDFGGHEHGDYGYHYHSFTREEVTPDGAGPSDPAGGVIYTSHNLPPQGAWAGRINDIPEFWDDQAPNYVGGISRYLGTE
jgi:hypothetical protein